MCDIVNGIPKVKRVEKGEYLEVRLTYSLFHREIKRYDKETFEEIKRR
ncbi:MAG: UDP-N-acetylmuramoyl-tripeptide--D-alanyl-D-alanine ligase [Clostridiales bacterium]|nr:UDP-N-acetylmuramoyl-tripeptide--D-alanyl-D-alanine ligase [Clostridiales bacterium]